MTKLRALLASSVALLAVSTADAQTFTGNTVGCFYTSIVCSPVTSPPGYINLDFTGANFSGTADAGGQLLLNGSAGLSLGTFTASDNSASNYNGNFILGITFTAPIGTSGPGSFTASVTGKLNGNGNNLVIDFEPAQVFTFPGGQFTLTVNDINIASNAAGTYSPVAVTGVIQASPIASPVTVVPEPTSVVLMAVGLSGLGIAIRRRRNA